MGWGGELEGADGDLSADALDILKESDHASVYSKQRTEEDVNK